MDTYPGKSTPSPTIAMLTLSACNSLEKGLVLLRDAQYKNFFSKAVPGLQSITSVIIENLRQTLEQLSSIHEFPGEGV